MAWGGKLTRPYPLGLLCKFAKLRQTAERMTRLWQFCVVLAAIYMETGAVHAVKVINVTTSCWQLGCTNALKCHDEFVHEVWHKLDQHPDTPPNELFDNTDLDAARRLLDASLPASVTTATSSPMSSNLVLLLRREGGSYADAFFCFFCERDS